MPPAMFTSRLAPDASLDVFRVLLDAISHPGRPFSLDRGLGSGKVGIGGGKVGFDRENVAGAAIGGLPVAALPLLSLADIDVVVAVAGPESVSSGLGRVIARSTGARLTDEVGAADLVLAVRGTTSGDLLALRVGSHEEPERGAKLFIACEAIGVADGGDRPHDEPWLSVRVDGPGASAGRRMILSGLDRTVLEFLAACNSSFPAGADAWIIATDGTVVAIPRSCSISLTQGAH